MGPKAKKYINKITARQQKLQHKKY